MERMIIQIGIKEQLCNGKNCPLRNAIVLAQAQQIVEGGMSLDSLSEICVAQGLVPANDYYSEQQQLPNGENDLGIYTADCKAGSIMKTDDTHCGSLIANLEGAPRESNQAVILEKTINENWIHYNISNF